MRPRWNRPETQTLWTLPERSRRECKLKKHWSFFYWRLIDNLIWVCFLQCLFPILVKYEENRSENPECCRRELLMLLLAFVKVLCCSSFTLICKAVGDSLQCTIRAALTLAGHKIWLVLSNGRIKPLISSAITTILHCLFVHISSRLGNCLQKHGPISNHKGRHSLHAQPQILMLVAWELPMTSLSWFQPVFTLHRPFPSSKSWYNT